MTSSDRRPRILLFVILAAFAVSKLPLASVPYHWDEMGYVATISYYYYETGLYPIAHLETYHDDLLRRLSVDSGHPPLFYLAVAALWRLTGPVPWVPRLLALALALVAIASTSALGARLLDARSGVAAALALAANPLFFAQSGTAHLDLPLAGLAVASLAAIASDRLGPFLVAATAMMLVKAQAVLLQPAITAYVVLRARRRAATRAIAAREIAVWHAPVLAWLVWKAWFVLDTGTLVTHNAYNTQPLRSLGALAHGAARSIYFGLVQRGTFLFAGAALLALAVLAWQRRLRGSGAAEIALLLVLPVVTVLAVQTPLRNNGARYFLVTLPLVILLGVGGLRALGVTSARAIAIAILPAITFEVCAWWGTDPLLRIAEAAGLVRVSKYKDRGAYWNARLRVRIGDDDLGELPLGTELLTRAGGGGGEAQIPVAREPRAEIGAPVVVTESVGAEVAGEDYTWPVFEGNLSRLQRSPPLGLCVIATDSRDAGVPVPEPVAAQNDSHENTLDYLAVVRLHGEAMRWIGEQRPGARVLANWPGVFAARYPYLGYVPRPLPVVYLAPVAATVKLSDFDLLYASEDAMFPDMQSSVVHRLGLRPAARFESTVGRVTIYEAPRR